MLLKKASQNDYRLISFDNNVVQEIGLWQQIERYRVNIISSKLNLLFISRRLLAIYTWWWSKTNVFCNIILIVLQLFTGCLFDKSPALSPVQAASYWFWYRQLLLNAIWNDDDASYNEKALELGQFHTMHLMYLVQRRRSYKASIFSTKIRTHKFYWVYSNMFHGQSVSDGPETNCWNTSKNENQEKIPVIWYNSSKYKSSHSHLLNN